MVDSCEPLNFAGEGPFIVVDYAGNALGPDGKFGTIAMRYPIIEAARVAQPEGKHTRILFTSQWRKFRLCGCLKG